MLDEIFVMMVGVQAPFLPLLFTTMTTRYKSRVTTYATRTLKIEFVTMADTREVRA
jgi:hypothetical protein